MLFCDGVVVVVMIGCDEVWFGFGVCVCMFVVWRLFCLIGVCMVCVVVMFV